MKPNAKARTPLFDLDLLKAIVMVADCGTFTAASARLHSTQSTVSQKVRRLEDMAGHKLLDRGSRDVSPTDAGETLLGYARRMLALNDEMIEALSGATVGLTVRLGVPEDFVGGPTTHMLAAFNRKHPQVKLEVTSGLSRDVGNSYDRGDLDLILVKQRRNSREAVACWPEQLRWIDSAKNPSFQLDPIPHRRVSAAGAVPRRHDQRDRRTRTPLADELHQFEFERHSGGRCRWSRHQSSARARGDGGSRCTDTEKRAACD